MPQRAAIRDAIEQIESTVDAGNVSAQRVLARLYATYAQATLEAHGIHVDLQALCGERLPRPVSPEAETAGPWH